LFNGFLGQWFLWGFNMINKVFLEIVVPTFNRADILRSTLSELSAVVYAYSGRILLRVIDNCSTDSTPSVVNGFKDSALFAAQRNHRNIGLIKNIAKCIETSSAEWVWVFGDDDHLLLHCLPLLLKTLEQLPQDVVFARGLAANVNKHGRIVGTGSCPFPSHHGPVTLYEPGIEIAAGHIHSLAFISSLLIRPVYWNKGFHDSIYSDSDLYTFVLTLLHEAKHRRTADLNFHVVAATDRGDRSYYTPNMCVARLTEFTRLEKLVFAECGSRKARRLLRNGRRGLLKLRIASCSKLIGYCDSYRVEGLCPIHFMCAYSSPYLIDQLVVRSLGRLAGAVWIRSLFRFVYDTLFEAQQRDRNSL
jgi:glycosyltransferase involved in cell wall biosynthesis